MVCQQKVSLKLNHVNFVCGSNKAQGIEWRIGIFGAFLNNQVRHNDTIRDKLSWIALFKNEAQFIPESFLGHHKVDCAFIEHSFGARSLGKVSGIRHLHLALVDKVEVILQDLLSEVYKLKVQLVPFDDPNIKYEFNFESIYKMSAASPRSKTLLHSGNVAAALGSIG